MVFSENHEALTGIFFAVEKGDYPAEGSVVFSDQAFGHQEFLGYLPQKASYLMNVPTGPAIVLLNSSIWDSLQETGFRIEAYRLELYGIWTECSAGAKREEPQD